MLIAVGMTIVGACDGMQARCDLSIVRATGGPIVGVGIEVSPSAVAGLNWLRAGGSVEATTLHALLMLGAPCPEAGMHGRQVTLAWCPTDKGPAVIAKGPGRVVAALVAPFDHAALEWRAAHHLAVDGRGSLQPPDDLSDWWPMPDAELHVVDAYNATVLAVRDITAQWPF